MVMVCRQNGFIGLEVRHGSELGMLLGMHTFHSRLPIGVETAKAFAGFRLCKLPACYGRRIMHPAWV